MASLPPLPTPPPLAPSQSAYHLRPVNLDTDLSAIRGIFKAGMNTYSSRAKDVRVQRAWEQYTAHSLQDDLADIAGVYLNGGVGGGGGAFFVVVRTTDGTVVGHVGVEQKSEDECELRRMSVAPGLRGSGLGLRLVREVEAFARRQGYAQVVLSTGSLMAPAMGLYARAGYGVVRREAVGGFPMDKLHTVYYAKSLGGARGAGERGRSKL